jgi:proline iminopeptidase
VKARALLLHGGPGIGDYLGPLEDELAPLFEVTRYAQGRHLAFPPYVAETLARLAEPAWLVGHSFGGYLALRVAAAAPERTLGLILLGSVGAVGDGGRARANETLRSRLTAPPTGFADIWPAYFPAEPAPFPDDLTFDGEQNTAVTASMSLQPPIDEALSRYPRPVLALHGTYDHIPLTAVEETVALFSDGELRVLEGVGHFPWLEHPGLVRDAVVDFRASRSS